MFDEKLSILATQLGETLSFNNLTLTLAESCTGGLVSTSVTEIAGSSEWFDRGFIVYSNQAKEDILGVSADSLETQGAVSEEVAIEMALGAMKRSQAQISASITGIAGPSGGTSEKPVGTVCFAWTGVNLPTMTNTKMFHGNRHEIRLQAAAHCMKGLLELIND